jgi:hypothetical protein
MHGNLKLWAYQHDPVSNLVLTCQQFEEACGKGTWMATDEAAETVAEAAYQGLVLREFDGNRWRVKLMHRGRTYLTRGGRISQ